MQNLSSIKRILNYSNNQKLIKNIIYTKKYNFSSFKSEINLSVPHIENIGKEFKNSYERIQASIKPKTLNEIKKIQNFVKTTNAQNDLEE